MFNHLKNTFKKHIRKSFVPTPTYTTYPFDIKKLPDGYTKSFGEKNPDKTFYVIWLDTFGSGFFSNFTYVIAHIKIALSKGMIPVVDFENFKSFYNVETLIQNTKNSWEYYFKPVSPYSLEEVYKSKNVLFCNGTFPASEGYSLSQIKGAKKIYNDHIFLQPYIEHKINEYSENFSEKVLGVHFRGQEMKIASGHPFPPTEKQMLKYVDRAIDQFGFKKIFFVSEELSYLELFTKKYGKKIFYTNAFRTHEKNAYLLNPRENHRYQLGVEVLIDAYLLSKCTALICSDSNVSEFARFINENKYDFVHFIDNGYNSPNILLARYLYSIKKNLPPQLGGLKDKLVILK